MRTLSSVFLLTASVVLSGCGSLNCVFVRSVQTSHGIILPEYLGYVAGDATLNEEEKGDVRLHVEKLRALVEEAAALCQ